MANYVEVADVEQLPPGRGTVVTVEGKHVALFNVDGMIYAIEDACLHHGMSLGTSKLEGKVVICRGHGWKYDVTTGSTHPVPGIGVAAYAVKIVEGKILVAIDETLGSGNQEASLQVTGNNDFGYWAPSREIDLNLSRSRRRLAIQWRGLQPCDWRSVYRRGRLVHLLWETTNQKA